MNNAQPASSRRAARIGGGGVRGFTLIELLVVIAIISVLSGLIISVVVRASQSKIEKVARVQLKAIETLIERYRHREGFYPPDNRQNLVDSARTQLFYELVGAQRESDNFRLLRGDLTVSKTQLQDAFGVGHLVNSSSDRTELKNYLGSFSTKLTAGGGGSLSIGPVHANGALGLLMPLKGPAPAVVPKGFIPVHYVSSGPTNNPNTFDLWVEVEVRGKTRIIGNWKE